MDAFYAAFAPACLALLGLWLVVIQIRLPQWQASANFAVYRKGAYGIALHFALPGLMGVLALVDSGNSAYWRSSFAVIALGGAVMLIAMRGRSDWRKPESGSAPGFPVGGGPGLTAYLIAIAAYALVGVLALVGGLAVLRVEGILLAGLVFLGFNAAWLLLFDGGPDARPQAFHAQPQAYGATTGSGVSERIEEVSGTAAYDIDEAMDDPAPFGAGLRC